MKLLLFSSAYNGLTQRVDRELMHAGHEVSIELGRDVAVMERAVADCNPELIICPFLKHRVPEPIWQRIPCLIVHPGIEGDRGPSSLDWAISENARDWGVTLLQADWEMDAGDIWATAEFPMRPAAKAAMYRREVTRAACSLVHHAVAGYRAGTVRPRPLEPESQRVKGRWRSAMPQSARKIDWHGDTTATVVRKIRAADSAPGVLDEIHGRRVYLYGAVADGPVAAAPGECVSQCDGAVRRATRDGSVWIRQMKRARDDNRRYFKLPAADVLAQQNRERGVSARLPGEDSTVVRAIRVETQGAIAWVRFDFYNGAMSTDQCRELHATLSRLREQPEIHVVVLLGGEDFFSNGIHLNLIEAAADPAREAWRNINAMDDLVREVIENDRQITIAALGANAGAGGTIFPLACDRVWCREGVVLNPHYATMGLYGSEYWTYLLPARVGRARADRLVADCLPVVAAEAEAIGLVDETFSEDWPTYQQTLQARVEALAANPALVADVLATKRARRQRDDAERPLADYRVDELEKMKASFDDANSDFHRLRREFVYKTADNATPARLRHRRTPAQKRIVTVD